MSVAREPQVDGLARINPGKILEETMSSLVVDPAKTVGNFYTARLLAGHAIKVEKALIKVGEKPWDYYGSGIEAYSKEFQKVLKGRSFQGIIDARNQRQSSVFAMDLMGEGAVLQDLEGLAGGLSVTLVDGRKAERVKADEAKRFELIAGSVYEGSTWAQVSNFKEQNMKSEGFDLVIASPKGGWYWDAGGQHFIRSGNVNLITQKAWASLNQDGGELFIKMPDEYFVYNWVRELRAKGLVDTAQLNGQLLNLVKTPESPKKLPRIEGLSVVEIYDESNKPRADRAVVMADKFVGG